jgi:hypothetical protein
VVYVALAACVRGIHEPRSFFIWRHHDDVNVEVFKGVLERVPLFDGALAVDGSLAAPTCPGVWVCAALHAEVTWIAHQDRALEVAGLVFVLDLQLQVLWPRKTGWKCCGVEAAFAFDVGLRVSCIKRGRDASGSVIPAFAEPAKWKLAIRARRSLVPV